jgi:hypothetical protein
VFISAYGIRAVYTDTLQQQQKPCYLWSVSLLKEHPVEHKEVSHPEISIVSIMASCLITKMGCDFKQLRLL